MNAAENKRIVYPFADPESKYTMFDNYLLDRIMPEVKPNAWKVLCLIIRKTRGWHKTADKISFSQIKSGTGISSDETVSNALKQLVSNRYILAKKGGQWDATEYAINTAFSATITEAEKSPTTEIEAAPTTEIEAAPTTEIEDTKESSLNKVNKKASSAEADHSREISFLTEEEVRAKVQFLKKWTAWLEDERAERKRKGVIKFLEGKIAKGALLPDTPAAHTLFEKLGVEAEAKGRRPPDTFPTLAVKDKFNAAADRLNGTLEPAITKALESGITGIPRIVNYISSPKWREESNGQNRTGTRKHEANGTAKSGTGGAAHPAPGSGQTPEMAERLRAAFEPTPA